MELLKAERTSSLGKQLSPERQRGQVVAAVPRKRELRMRREEIMGL
jgi:hypothetical protein